jgi:hypothetical protein
LSWCATKKLRDVGRRRGGFVSDLGELPLELRTDKLREGATLLADANVDTPVSTDRRVSAQMVVLVRKGARDLRVGRQGLVWRSGGR